MGRHSKSIKHGSMTSSAVNKKQKLSSPEEKIVKGVADTCKQKSLRKARDLELAMFDKNFGYYNQVKESLYQAKMDQIVKKRKHYSEGKSASKKVDKMQKLSTERFKLIVKITSKAIKLALPFYYERDLYRYLAISKLSSTDTLIKLHEMLNSPFITNSVFAIKMVTGMNLPQLDTAETCKMIPWLFDFYLSKKPEIPLKVY